MAHLTDKPGAKPNAKPDAARQEQSRTDKLRLWLALTGGSIAVHLLAAVILLPIASRAAVHKKSLEVSPIDFVELPGTKNAVRIEGESAKGAIAPVVPVQPPVVSPPAAQNSGDQRDSGAVGLEPPVTPPVIPAVMPSVEPSIAPSAEPAPLPTQSPRSKPAASATPSQSSTSEASPQSPSEQQSLSGQSPEAIPQASGQALPQVTTEKISAAVPDTSAQYSAETQPIPLMLMASLQVVDVPPEQLENPPPDAIAQPMVISYTFAPNSEDTVCVPESESAQFAASITLGAKVGVQVVTNELGQVIDTALWQPSQNPLNDQLATCLVKNWNWKFQPAIAQGKPITSKALVIWVKIDRS